MKWGQSRKVWAKSWKDGPVGEKGFRVLSILMVCLRSLGTEAMKSLSEIMGRGRERAWDSGLGTGTGHLRSSARASDVAVAANGHTAAGTRSCRDGCSRCFLGCAFLFAGLQVFVDPTQHLFSQFSKFCHFPIASGPYNYPDTPCSSGDR